MALGRLLTRAGAAAYRGATSKAGAIGIIGAAAGIGMASKALPAARDAALDVAFGDPNADESFLGRKLTPGAVVDSMMPGGAAGTTAAAATGLGAIVGGGIGTYVGRKSGVRAAARAGNTTGNLLAAGARSTVADNLLSPVTRTLGGGIGGALIGAGIGAGIFAAASSAYINRNERFFRESPYVGNRKLNRDMSYGGNLYNSRNSSLQTAQELNADGNIVLGMHNLRRGG